MISKEEANYRHSEGEKHCGNCSMFRSLVLGIGVCTLVRGVIKDEDVCDRWDEK